MGYLTDQELLEHYEYYTMQLEEQLQEGQNFEAICEKIPAIAHLSRAGTHEIVHVNKKYTEDMGYTLEEVQANWSNYVETRIHPATVAFCFEAFPKLYAQNNPCQTLSFIQHVRLNTDSDYTPLISFARSANLPDRQSLWLEVTPKDFGKLSKQMEQVVRMDEFKLKHFKRFQGLTDREVEILSLLANGHNNPQIAEQLFISRKTVETHRRNLKRKLDIRSYGDLMRYAFAFNLVET